MVAVTDAVSPSRFRRLTPALVLGLLTGIGWWGHTFHWDLGRTFAQAPPPGGTSAAEPSSGKSTSPDSPAADDHPKLRLVSGDLPAIRFRSVEGARNCGIDTAAVEARSLDESLSASAVVAYDGTRVAQLASRVAGTVARVEKRPGDQVEKGDPLVIIDSAEVGEAKAALLEACVMYRFKQQHVERLSPIREAIAGRQLLEAEASLEMARAQRINALQKVINLGFRLTLPEIETLPATELSSKLHLLGLPASYDPQTTSFNLIPLVAPFTGVVTSCDVVYGETVEPLKPFYEMADTRRMWIELSVRQDDTPQLRLGTPVMFETEAKTGPVTGTLTWIGTAIDPKTRTIPARAEVDLAATSQGDASSAPLRAGAFGTARILVQSHPEAVTIRDSALHWQWEIGREVVFVADEDGCSFQPRVVRKGLVRDGHVQILEGLKPGERVVTVGSRVLSGELSDHLQEQLGDNSEAARAFHHASDNPAKAS